MDDKVNLFEILKQLREGGHSQVRYRPLLEQTIAALSESLPFKGRIQTQEKIYAGMVEQLTLEKGGKRLEFQIRDIVAEGEQGAVHHKHVAVDELVNIEKW